MPGGRTLPLAVVYCTASLVALEVDSPILATIPSLFARIGPWLLLGAGLAWAARSRTDLAIGAVGASLGAAGHWIASDPGAAPAWRGAARYLAVLLVPSTGFLVLRSIDRHVRTDWVRAGSIALWLTVGFGVAHATVYDPFSDPACWRFCQRNPMVVASAPSLADVLGLAAALSAAVATAIVTSDVIASRHRIRPGFVPIAVAGCVVMLSGVAIERSIDQHAESTLRLAELSLAVTTVALAFALVIPVVQRQLTLRRVRAFAAALESADANPSFAAGLAEALHDPALQIGYPLGGGEQLVDARGEPIALGATGRATTDLIVNGDVIAVVDHDSSIASSEVLDRIGLSSRIVAWNEGLVASARRRLAELQQSSRRIVQIGDGERRRLERDLHDGAQQQLLALAYGLRQAGRHSGSRDLEPVFEEALTEARSALSELRSLAHGIFPAVLAESGLAAALLSLAERADHPTVVEFEANRVEESAARTVYAVADEAISSSHSATTTLRMTQVGEELVMSIDGVPSQPTVGIRDRVHAVGGTITTTANSWEVLIPCGS